MKKHNSTFTNDHSLWENYTVNMLRLIPIPLFGLIVKGTAHIIGYFVDGITSVVKTAANRLHSKD